MTKWPFKADGWVPPPELVAVLSKLGMIPAERVPLWAAHWLVAGHDGEHVVHLAGLHGDEFREIREILPAALLDCGVILPESEAAAATVVYTALARLHLDGRAEPLWVCQKVDELLCDTDFDDDLIRLPLSRLWDVACEWDKGLGWSVQHLASFVQEACEDQVRQASVATSMRDPEHLLPAVDLADGPERAVHVLEGGQIESLDDFWRCWLKIAGDNGRYFGRNLAAFDDALSGGPGWPEGAVGANFIVEWRDHEISQASLGRSFSHLVEVFERRVPSCLKLC